MWTCFATDGHPKGEALSISAGYFNLLICIETGLYPVFDNNDANIGGEYTPYIRCRSLVRLDHPCEFEQ